MSRQRALGRQSGFTQNGFTLIEMMVALFIFGMLATASVLLLRQSVTAQAASSERLDEIGDMRRFSALMAQDLGALIVRSGQDGRGEVAVAFDTNAIDGALMVFTRQMTILDDTGPASPLQRIRYAVRDGRLERSFAAFADGGQMSVPAEILSGFDRIEMRVRDPQGAWVTAWQPQRADAVPSAIELSIYRRSNGGGQSTAPLVMRFLVGGG